MKPNRVIAAFAVAAALTTTVAACSSTPAAEPQPTTSAAATPAVSGSAADVAFAQGMIPHHQQAVEMADMALAPQADASPQVKKLAREIKAAQDPEIQQMTAWLQQWGAPTSMPDASGDMAGMDHGGHEMGGITMSGMMTAEQMQVLGASQGQAFDTMWLQMMIAHHEGAVQMAEQVKQNSDNPQVTELADQIIAAQQQEIAEMQQLLAQS